MTSDKNPACVQYVFRDDQPNKWFKPNAFVAENTENFTENNNNSAMYSHFCHCFLFTMKVQKA